jgi:hypothetical protein
MDYVYAVYHMSEPRLALAFRCRYTDVLWLDSGGSGLPIIDIANSR